MTIILVLTGISILLWIIPAIYVVQCGSWRILLETGILFLVSVCLPFAVARAESELYGLAAVIKIDNALVIAGLQLMLWLGALVLTLHANACRLPHRFGANDHRSSRQDAPAAHADR